MYNADSHKCSTFFILRREAASGYGRENLV